ncbi:uncharacterized protein LOC132951290 isoform X4 [Metopolophium dirhodum]|uniref:uncharacterized protein LOC132951290 isoform X4 n=1 Tax=Metopolophium dirhodum TaxID=44670 RepID=UPI00298F4B1B|nr:uncharacterized protein LOC132951290 isoform X4 [Metopolophium dirhodum]
MSMVVELIRLSSRPEDQTPLKSVAGGPIAAQVVDTTAADVAPLPDSAENSAPVTTENGTPLPVGSVEKPSPVEAVTTENGTPLPICSVVKPSAARTPHQAHINIGKRDMPYFRNSTKRAFTRSVSRHSAPKYGRKV